MSTIRCRVESVESFPAWNKTVACVFAERWLVKYKRVLHVIFAFPENDVSNFVLN